MDSIEEIDIKGSDFDKIFEDIKRKFLSNQYFPKLILGTGLSIVMGLSVIQKSLQ